MIWLSVTRVTPNICVFQVRTKKAAASTRSNSMQLVFWKKHTSKVESVANQATNCLLFVHDTRNCMVLVWPDEGLLGPQLPHWEIIWYIRGYDVPSVTRTDTKKKKMFRETDYKKKSRMDGFMFAKLMKQGKHMQELCLWCLIVEVVLLKCLLSCWQNNLAS